MPVTRKSKRKAVSEQSDLQQTRTKNVEKQKTKTTTGAREHLQKSHEQDHSKQNSRCHSSDETTEILNFKARKIEPKINIFTPMVERSENLVHFLQQYTWGQRCAPKLAQSVSSSVVNLISDLQLCRTASPFDRRVTVIEWHPTKSHVMVVGSKGGDLIMWDTQQFNNDKFIQGTGAGGNIYAMRFWPEDNDKVVTADGNGQVTLFNFEDKPHQILADTMNENHEKWYCSVDVGAAHRVVAAGDNFGYVQLLAYNGEKLFNYRLHKNKVNSIEFSPREDWLLCTSSTDKTVQLWDIRMIKDRRSYLQLLTHDRAVNSAFFSKTDGCKLLTTDQYNQVRVYQAPEWALSRTIQHPHRFFQHITPIKATWHPLQDLAVVGRYPDPSDPSYHEGELRTIDIINTDTSQLVTSLCDPSASGLVCVNKFNRQGDVLASGMGLHILLWKRKEETMRSRESLMNSAAASSNLDSVTSRSGRSNSRPSGDLGKKPTKSKDSKTKLKEKEKTLTFQTNQKSKKK